MVASAMPADARTSTKAGNLSGILNTRQLSAKPVEADAASSSPAMQLPATAQRLKELTGYTSTTLYQALRLSRRTRQCGPSGLPATVAISACPLSRKLMPAQHD